jgi:hypothetical protein
MFEVAIIDAAIHFNKTREQCRAGEQGLRKEWDIQIAVMVKDWRTD